MRVVHTVRSAYAVHAVHTAYTVYALTFIGLNFRGLQVFAIFAFYFHSCNVSGRIAKALCKFSRELLRMVADPR